MAFIHIVTYDFINNSKSDNKFYKHARQRKSRLILFIKLACKISLFQQQTFDYFIDVNR